MLRPFVFPRITSPTVVDDVRELNRRIKRELVRRGASDGFDLKNGEGGIREIEFFVQALQLIHAGKRPSCARAARSPRSTRCCSPASSPTTSTSRCGARIAGCATPSTCCSSRAGCRRRRVPERRRRARACSRSGSATSRDVAFAIELVTHTDRGRAAVRDARRRARRRASPTSTRSCAASCREDAEAAALARLGFADVTAARAELARARRRPGSPLSPAATERSARIGARAALRDRGVGRSRSGAALPRRSDRAARRSVVDLAPARRAAGDRAPARLAARRERVPRAHARRHARS